jgi:hypothetical protein
MGGGRVAGGFNANDLTELSTRRTPFSSYIDSEYIGIRGAKVVPFAVAIHYPVNELASTHCLAKNRHYAHNQQKPAQVEAPDS